MSADPDNRSLIERLLPDSEDIEAKPADQGLDPYDSIARLKRAKENETVENMIKRMGLD